MIFLYVRDLTKEFMETLRRSNAVLPAIATVRGFSNHLIHFDTLHVLYRGFGPDFVGSTLLSVFGGRALGEAHDLAHAWCRLHGCELSVEEFSFAYEGKYPNLMAKGWDVRLLILWLATWMALVLRFNAPIQSQT